MSAAARSPLPLLVAWGAIALASPATGLTLVVEGLDGMDATATTEAEDGESAEARLLGASDAENVAYAEGGRGGGRYDDADPGGPGDGGDALAEVEASSTSDLTARAEAVGGRGGWGRVVGGRAGDAHASAVARNATDASLDVTAIATGGEGGWADAAGPGGVASLGPVLGESTGGGAVTVLGRIEHGEPGRTLDRDSSPRPGRDATLHDAVDGNTTGALSITQEAFAGDSPGAESSLDGGRAESWLSKTTSSESLFLRTYAVGGSAGLAASGPSGDGGEGRAFSFARNLAGGTTVETWGAGAGSDEPSTGDGGAGWSTAVGIAAGPGPVTVRGRASGGWGGSFDTGVPVAPGTARGGDATSLSFGLAVEGPVLVEDLAEGGRGGRFVPSAPDDAPPAAGHADSTAFAVGRGAGTVVARAEAVGGAGGFGDVGHDGGDATAHATAVSLGGDAQAFVTQRGGDGGGLAGGALRPGDGADSHVVDAARGSAAGTLTLEQRAIGGDAGRSRFGGELVAHAGDAGSHLRQTNAGGGDLSLFTRAEGGDLDPRGVANDFRAGDATTSAVGWSDTGADVAVRAESWGGDGNAYEGGRARFGEVSATSNGGDVEAWALGFGGGTRNGSQIGADVEMIDVVDGRTSGSIRLFQWADAGHGFLAGSGRSELDRRWDAASVSADLRAEAGSSPAGGRPGDATVRADLRNVGGEVRLLPRSYAGDQFAEGGDGGDATVDVHLEGRGRVQSRYSNPVAEGGDSGTGADSRGGTATTRISGIVHDDGVLTLRHEALGGSGRSSKTGDHGSGGRAFAEGHGLAGAGPLSVDMVARGGTGGMTGIYDPAWSQGSGGDGRAVAEGHGDGFVQVSATGIGGRALFSDSTWSWFDPADPFDQPRLYGLNGTGRSRAVGSGSDGFVTARSGVDGGFAGEIFASARFAVESGATFVAESVSTHRGGFGSYSPDAQAWSGGSLHPALPAGELDLRGARHFDGSRRDELIAVGSLGARLDGDPDVPTEVDLVYQVEFRSFVEEGSADLFLEVMSPVAMPSAFDALALQVRANGLTVFDFATDDASEALAALDGLLLDVGDILPPVPNDHVEDHWVYVFSSVTVELELLLAEAGAGFAFDLAIGHAGAPVPEPPPWALLLAGLAAWSCRSAWARRTATGE
jgi:hypothetical protein